LANEAWRQGNHRHAQDMFSIFRESCLHDFYDGRWVRVVLINYLQRALRAIHRC
jgi:hypothetical protein